jgi:hypothetical protein
LTAEAPSFQSVRSLFCIDYLLISRQWTTGLSYRDGVAERGLRSTRQDVTRTAALTMLSRAILTAGHVLPEATA